MKLQDLKEAAHQDDDDEFPTANLKNLSKHVFHGRAFVSARDADKAFDAAWSAQEGDGDVSIWDHWESDTVYEVSIASTTRDGAKRVLDSIKSAVPRANLSTAHKSGMIDHRDWREYP